MVGTRSRPPPQIAIPNYANLYHLNYDFTDEKVIRSDPFIEAINNYFIEARSMNDDVKKLIAERTKKKVPNTPKKKAAATSLVIAQIDHFRAINFDDESNLDAVNFDAEPIVDKSTKKVPNTPKKKGDATPLKKAVGTPKAQDPYLKEKINFDLNNAEQRRIEYNKEKAEKVKKEREEREKKVKERQQQMEEETRRQQEASRNKEAKQREIKAKQLDVAEKDVLGVADVVEETYRFRTNVFKVQEPPILFHDVMEDSTNSFEQHEAEPEPMEEHVEEPMDIIAENIENLPPSPLPVFKVPEPRILFHDVMEDSTNPFDQHEAEPEPMEEPMDIIAENNEYVHPSSPSPPAAAHNKSCYDMTADKVFLPSTETNYNVDDLSSGDETDDESKPKKTVPNWAKKHELNGVVKKMLKDLTMDERCKFFGIVQQPSTEIIFNIEDNRHRNSSFFWQSPLTNPTAGISRLPLRHHR